MNGCVCVRVAGRRGFCIISPARWPPIGVARIRAARSRMMWCVRARLRGARRHAAAARVPFCPCGHATGRRGPRARLECVSRRLCVCARLCIDQTLSGLISLTKPRTPICPAVHWKVSYEHARLVAIHTFRVFHKKLCTRTRIHGTRATRAAKGRRRRRRATPRRAARRLRACWPHARRHARQRPPPTRASR